MNRANGQGTRDRLSQRSPKAMLQRLEKTDAELHRILWDVRNRSAWDDTFIDALCELTETFTFGGVFAHIMTFNAHRRLVSAIPWSMRKLWPLGTGR